LIGPSSLKGTGANGGETIVLYGTGFGPSNPAVSNGQINSQALPLVMTPTVLIEGMVASVKFAGIVSPVWSRSMLWYRADCRRETLW